MVMSYTLAKFQIGGSELGIIFDWLDLHCGWSILCLSVFFSESGQFFISCIGCVCFEHENLFGQCLWYKETIHALAFPQDQIAFFL